MKKNRQVGFKVTLFLRNFKVALNSMYRTFLQIYFCQSDKNQETFKSSVSKDQKYVIFDLFHFAMAINVDVICLLINGLLVYSKRFSAVSSG